MIRVYKIGNFKPYVAIADIDELHIKNRIIVGRGFTIEHAIKQLEDYPHSIDCKDPLIFEGIKKAVKKGQVPITKESHPEYFI